MSNEQALLAKASMDNVRPRHSLPGLLEQEHKQSRMNEFAFQACFTVVCLYDGRDDVQPIDPFNVYIFRLSAPLFTAH